MNGKKVLALDLGTNSIGWALVNEPAQEILATGVRIFPEGVDREKSGGEVAKNQKRRVARGMRRQIARRAKRKRTLRLALVEAGLLPKEAALPATDPNRNAWENESFAKADPYHLRLKALESKLEPHEIGRVLLHLNKRRGFLSNRKADRAKKEEDSKLLGEISQLEKRIQEAAHRTLGEHLANLQSIDPTQRIRGLHTRRDMLLKEFELVWVQLVRLQLAKTPAFFAIRFGGQSQKRRVFDESVELAVAPNWFGKLKKPFTPIF